MLLTDIKENSKATIRSISAGKELTSRLSALGLIPGTEITMSRNSGKGPLIILIRESRIALGRGMAEKVTVS